MSASPNFNLDSYVETYSNAANPVTAFDKAKKKGLTEDQQAKVHDALQKIQDLVNNLSNSTLTDLKKNATFTHLSDVQQHSAIQRFESVQHQKALAELSETLEADIQNLKEFSAKCKEIEDYLAGAIHKDGAINKIANQHDLDNFLKHVKEKDTTLLSRIGSPELRQELEDNPTRGEKSIHSKVESRINELQKMQELAEQERQCELPPHPPPIGGST